MWCRRVLRLSERPKPSAPSEASRPPIHSERDYARKIILKGRSSKETPVGEITTSPVFSVVPDQTIRDCMELMAERHIRHLPVLEKGRVVGMISMSDVAKAVIPDQETKIRELQGRVREA